VLLQEVAVIGSLIYTAADYDAVIADMAAGVYETTGWVDHTELDDLVNSYDELRAGRRMKILVDP
jgi:(R,R)-butanediol dehydrogenase / meso-butanediol dehydrogenase / diacetyl reductase